MKVLVVGQGGREHAIVRALRLSPSVTEVHCVPGSDGMRAEALCHSVDTNDFEAIGRLVKRTSVDLVVVGPESDLVSGLSDFLRAQGTVVLGPSQAAATLEGSKVYSKEFMQSAKVPTANFAIVDSVASTIEQATNFTPPFVLKADGLAAGKGVFICKTLEELELAAHDLFEEKRLGTAGDKALLEQFQPGWELSYLILTNGEDFQPLPLSQDHKRLGNDDVGPNTGGMGVVAPLKIDEALEQKIRKTILEPSVAELKRRNLLYRGILYVGVMVTPEGPSVLEYNVRFGDPEAQAVLPLLDGDWGEVMLAVASGELPILKWKPLHSACVVLAAPGYPDKPQKGLAIEGKLDETSPSSYFLHAGTKKEKDGPWVTNGGRVLNSVALGSTLKEAVDNAYQQASHVGWAGRQMRTDIGQKILCPKPSN